MSEMEYKTLGKREGWGSYGSFGMQVLIGGTMLPNMSKLTDEGKSAIWKAEEMLEDTLKKEWLRQQPKEQERAKEEREKLLALFGDRRIFVKEIPNGYSTQWYNVLRPWFAVYCDKGCITIGWRKRVIEIDWKEMVLPFPHFKPTAEELFKDQDVTKGDHYVHAWGYDKAKDYIERILNFKP